MTVTVRAKLPKGDTNGLAHLEGTLADRPDDVLVVIGLLRADTIEERPHDDDDPRCVKTVLLHLEAINGADGAKVDKMLRSVYEARTGKTSLPFEDVD
jgi:hypothetical protein